MKTCPNEQTIGRWFDGELHDDRALESHLSECPRCAAYLGLLERIRSGAQEIAGLGEIGDGQFPAFMAGIRDGARQPSRGRRGLWAAASLATAALVAAVSITLMFSDGGAPVEAQSVVESYRTEIEGATATSFYSEDGTATVWLNVPDGDMW